jgi:diguanylate cyclase (GGDEF)-like protein
MQLRPQARGTHLLVAELGHSTEPDRAEPPSGVRVGPLGASGELERRAAELASLNDLGRALQSCTGMDEAHAIVRRFAPPLFPDASGMVWLIDDRRTNLKATASWGAVAMSTAFPALSCPAFRARRSSPPLHGHNEVACALGAERPDQAALCTPLLILDEVIGVLHLQFSVPGRQPASRAERLLREQLAGSVALQITSTIANLRLRERLRRESLLDPPTGLYNRRYLDITLERELKMAGRQLEPLSLLILEVEHSKSVCSQVGRDAGDTLLRRLSVTLRSCLRSYDIICRYGAEELAVVLPRTSARDSEELAQRIRSAVSCPSDRAPQGGGLLPLLTASIGVATSANGATDVEALLRAADSALQIAQRQSCEARG